MEIREERTGECVVLALVGRLTVTDQTGLLKAAVVRALADGATHIVIDLSQVAYIDSTRLGELISTHITVAKQSRRLTLVSVPARISALLTLAGLSPLFEQQPSVDAARASQG